MTTREMSVIVMADDDDDDCMLAKDAFYESGWSGDFVCVEDGLKLMEYLSGSMPRPALILLDLNMPRKDGREVLKEIKAIPAFDSIPVVVLSTSREKRDMCHSRKLGANSFITKPATFGEWIEIMRSLTKEWLKSGQVA